MSDMLSGKMPFRNKVRYFLIVCQGVAVMGKGFFWFFFGLAMIGLIYIWHMELQASRVDIQELRVDNRQTHDWALGSEARYWEAQEDAKKARGKR